MINIAQPYFNEEEIVAVTNVLRSGIIAQGPRVSEFEKKFAEYCGAKYAIAVNSGTAALHTALYAAGIGKGDEIITTPFTFVATVNAILQLGAKPVFCDIEPVTFNIDPDKLERKITAKTKAILPVDIFGHPYAFEKIRKIANKNKLKIIEDACQAHGAVFKNKKAGALGDIGCFSFYATKNMTTGEGGILVTDNEKYAERARMFRHHGQSQKARYEYFDMGYNYRMTDISAAVGLAQLKKIENFNKNRIKNSAMLTKGLDKIKGIILPHVSPDCKHVFHQYTIRITKHCKMTRDEFSKYLSEKGIGNAVFYPKPLHLVPHIVRAAGKYSLPIVEQMVKEVLSLPVHPGVSDKDITYIIDTIKNI
ncbi:DegT/DnrJ/EryC1/StrS family aminotransferase [Candidatus Giovannonibacteria bacterium]|nr:DegT/DnrJ/EryC1/StrS family aminotransferase [Candidatus Giovannonibacteria bacterium]